MCLRMICHCYGPISEMLDTHLFFVKTFSQESFLFSNGGCQRVFSQSPLHEGAEFEFFKYQRAPWDIETPRPPWCLIHSYFEVTWINYQSTRDGNTYAQELLQTCSVAQKHEKSYKPTTPWIGYKEKGRYIEELKDRHEIPSRAHLHHWSWKCG